MSTMALTSSGSPPCNRRVSDVSPSTVPVGVEELVSLLADRIAERLLARLRRDEAGSEKWLTCAAAAEYLGVHPDTLRKAARAGHIRFEQDGPGCRMFFRREDLDESRLAPGTRGVEQRPRRIA